MAMRLRRYYIKQHESKGKATPFWNVWDRKENKLVQSFPSRPAAGSYLNRITNPPFTYDI